VTGEEATAHRRDRGAPRALGEQVLRVGDSLVIGAPDPARPLVLLVGHLDVVPPTDADRVPRRTLTTTAPTSSSAAGRRT
jgi:succinyl-diaminopimelate desuccinylase